MFNSCILNITMDKKTVYSYDDNGELQQYSVYVKLNIRSGFEVNEINKRDEMIDYLNKTFITSHIYPDSLLHSNQPLPKNRLYFERKDICSALKGNSCIFKFCSSTNILNTLSILDKRAKKYMIEIDNYSERLQKCIQSIISQLKFITIQEFSPKLMEVGDFLLNLKNICVYLLEEVIDGLIDVIFTIKQFEVSFQYNIETVNNTNRSILMLINELNELEKKMKETEVAILFKKISLDDYKDIEMDERISEILELPEEEMYKKLQDYLQDEIQTQNEAAIELRGQIEEESKDEDGSDKTINSILDNNENVVLICEDQDLPKLSISMTVDFIEQELVKIDSIIHS